MVLQLLLSSTGNTSSACLGCASQKALRKDLTFWGHRSGNFQPRVQYNLFIKRTAQERVFCLLPSEVISEGKQNYSTQALAEEPEVNVVQSAAVLTGTRAAGGCAPASAR